ncbi:hypothetical protein PIB30_092659 [Stylosanthes scabra]|uniref:Uncharacterized protein n=1 Tax=Stylosanthes scabra TaxID=79078 RepID=A0ABU6ZTJ0_9FABA|nr:hypothetical protein [Stylosanthes scabra]
MQHDLLRELASIQSDQEPIEQRKRLAIDLTQSGKNCPNWLIGQNQPGILSRMLSFLSLRGTQQQQEQKQVSACIMFISTDETFTANWYEMKEHTQLALAITLHFTSFIRLWTFSRRYSGVKNFGVLSGPSNAQPKFESFCGSQSMEAFLKKKRSLIAIALWQIWNARNQLIFEGKTTHSSEITLVARNAMEEFWR